jgi:hypothetical protein
MGARYRPHPDLSMNAADIGPPSPLPRIRGHSLWRWTAVVWAFVVIGIAARLVTMPGTPDVEDSILFVRGVLRFSISELRPHWPGYPVYIWLGKLITLAVGDPVLALHLISAAASALTAWPLAFVTRAWAISLGASSSKAGACGWGAALLWLASPMAWVTGGQIFSDPLGLLCGMTILALCVAGESGRRRAWTAAAVLAGVMLGVRLVNVTMLGPLVVECWRRRGERWRGLPASFVMVAAGLAGVLPWLIWLLARDPSSVVYGARAHVGGHFGQWGESLWTDAHPATRPLRALRLFAFYGLGVRWSGGWGLAVAASWVAVLALVMAWRQWRSTVARLVALWAVPHLAYVFIGHDMDFPRYMISAVALISIVGGLAPMRYGRPGLAAIVSAAVAMTAVSFSLAVRQRHQPPVEVRIARFLAGRHAAVAVVDHPGLPFFLDGADSDIAWMVAREDEVGGFAEAWTRAGREVFATSPPPLQASQWIPIRHFCRDPLINPYLSRDIWLFAPRSTASARAGAEVECDAD